MKLQTQKQYLAVNIAKIMWYFVDPEICKPPSDDIMSKTPLYPTATCFIDVLGILYNPNNKRSALFMNTINNEYGFELQLDNLYRHHICNQYESNHIRF